MSFSKVSVKYKANIFSKTETSNKSKVHLFEHVSAVRKQEWFVFLQGLNFSLHESIPEPDTLVHSAQ